MADPTDIVARLFQFDPTKSLQTGSNIGQGNIAAGVSIANANERGRSNRAQENLSQQRINQQSQQFNQSQALAERKEQNRQAEIAHQQDMRERGVNLAEINAEVGRNYDKARTNEILTETQIKNQQLQELNSLSTILNNTGDLDSVLGVLEGSGHSAATPSIGSDSFKISGAANFGGSGDWKFGRTKSQIENELTEVKSPSGASFKVHESVAGNFEGFLTDLEKTGYKINPGASSGFNWRKKRGGSTLSQHSYGTAIDINWDENKGFWNKANAANDPIAKVPGIEKIAARHGLTWGGLWSNKDTMQFEFNPANGVEARGISMKSPGLPQVNGGLFTPKSGDLRSTAFGPADIDPQTDKDISSGRMARANGNPLVGSSGVQYRGLEDKLPTIAHKTLPAGSRVKVTSDIFPDGREFQVAGTGPKTDDRIDFFTTNKEDYNRMANQKIQSVELLGDSEQTQDSTSQYSGIIERMREQGFSDDYIGLKLLEPKFVAAGGKYEAGYRMRLQSLAEAPRNKDALRKQIVSQQMEVYGGYDGKVTDYIQPHIDNLKKGIPFPEPIEKMMLDPKKVMRSPSGVSDRPNMPANVYNRYYGVDGATMTDIERQHAEQIYNIPPRQTTEDVPVRTPVPQPDGTIDVQLNPVGAVAPQVTGVSGTPAPTVMPGTITDVPVQVQPETTQAGPVIDPPDPEPITPPPFVPILPPPPPPAPVDTGAGDQYFD